MIIEMLPNEQSTITYDKYITRTTVPTTDIDTKLQELDDLILEAKYASIVLAQAEKNPEILEASTFKEALDMTYDIRAEVITESKSSSLANMTTSEKKAYYKQFSLRELAYITNSREISHSYAHSIIQSGTVNPLDWLGRLAKYEDYQRRPTAFTSKEILDIEIDYAGYTIDDFFELWNSGQWNIDKCNYVMVRLGIFDLDKWHELTGFIPKGQRFLPEVGSNIGKVVGLGTKAVSEITKGIFGGLAEGFGLTPEKLQSLKIKIIIAIIIIVVICILVGILVFYVKSRMLKSSLGVAKEVIK